MRPLLEKSGRATKKFWDKVEKYPEAHSTLVISRLARQSSSASRFTAGASGFLLLTQCRDRPER
jgi:hypothetical protein